MIEQAFQDCSLKVASICEATDDELGMMRARDLSRAAMLRAADLNKHSSSTETTEADTMADSLHEAPSATSIQAQHRLAKK